MLRKPNKLIAFNVYYFVVLSVSRDFSGNGYLKYDILGNNDNKPINSDVDTLSLTFRTLQPTGLLFHSQNSGGDQGDYITLGVIGGRLRYCHQRYCTV